MLGIWSTECIFSRTSPSSRPQRSSAGDFFSPNLARATQKNTQFRTMQTAAITGAKILILVQAFFAADFWRCGAMHQIHQFFLWFSASEQAQRRRDYDAYPTRTRQFQGSTRSA